jgi:hypothetical protein
MPEVVKLIVQLVSENEKEEVIEFIKETISRSTKISEKRGRIYIPFKLGYVKIYPNGQVKMVILSDKLATNHITINEFVRIYALSKIMSKISLKKDLTLIKEIINSRRNRNAKQSDKDGEIEIKMSTAVSTKTSDVVQMSDETEIDKDLLRELYYVEIPALDDICPRCGNPLTDVDLLAGNPRTFSGELKPRKVCYKCHFAYSV